MLSLDPLQPGTLDRRVEQTGFNENDSQRQVSLLPGLQLPNTRAPGVSFGLGTGQLGGSASVQQSQSQSTPGLLSPDSGTTANSSDQLQGSIGLNDLQGRAINQQQQLGGDLRNILGDIGQGARNRINQKFDVASKNVKGALTSRGFAGSSLNLPGQIQVESGRQGELGQLEAQLLGKRSDSESENAKGVSDLLFGSSKQSTNLLSGILGSFGVGNFGDSSNSQSSASNNKPSNLGGGSRGGSSTQSAVQSRNGIGDLPRLGDQQLQKSGTGGGSSGGPQSQNNISGGGPANLPNPFANPLSNGSKLPDGGNPEDFNKTWGNDKQTQDGTPLEDQELEPDRGPLQTPEAFARNTARLKAQQARDAVGAAPPPSADNSLAQSAAGTAGLVDAGASLA